jgi:hypothetical protein
MVSPGITEMVTDGITVGFTVIVIPEEVAVVGVAHGAFEVRIQVTTSPFASAEEVYVVPPVPTFDPFTCH